MQIRASQRVGIAGLVACVVLLAWATWPRPTTLEIEYGGRAFVKGLFTRGPLEDTLFISAQADGRLRIINHDTIGHIIGPFPVGAADTMEFRIPRRGVYRAVCTVHPSGQLIYVVK